MFLQKTESVHTLPFNKLPYRKSDFVIHFLVTELADDSTTHPQEAPKFILLKRPNEFLGHRAQQREAVYTIRIDNVFEIFSHRLRDMLCGAEDGERVAKG